MMAENIDDYAAIGAAVQGNQEEVSAAIQRLRAQAYAAGALRSTPQQQVEVEQYGGQPYYAIQPVNPQVVYVPQYDPTVVYAGNGLSPALITFGFGIGITALLVSQPWGWGGWGWNWGSRRIYYNRGPWGGWQGGYRPPRPWYRPRPVYYNQRPGYGGNWGYRPPNYRAPQPVRNPVYTRPGSNRPGYRPPTIQPVRPNPPGNRPVNGPGNRPPGNNRPPTTQPVRPNPPGNRPVNGPGYRPPGNNRPPDNIRPPNGGRPTTQPVRPGAPGNRPVNGPGNSRPPAQTRPQNQPARPQQRPQGAISSAGREGNVLLSLRNEGGGDII